MVKFSGEEVVASDKNTVSVIKTLTVPTLNEVKYNTILGDNMIVFDGHGTSGYIKREHGGDLRLKSWFGFRKNITVNCTGLVMEGLYPAE